MKILIILLFVVINLFNCHLSSLHCKAKSESENLSTRPTPDAVVCREENYKLKSKAAIASMTPRQLIDELVKINNNSFNDYAQLADYETFIEQRIRQAGIDALLVLIEYMNAYDPQSASECNASRFAKAIRMSEDIDRFEFRLKGTKEGQLAIEAFERAIKRIEKSGIEDRALDDKHSTLNQLKGITFVDEAIQDTFWVRKRIKISDSELLDFSNFLTERDPTYPSWNDTEFISDYSRVKKGELPMRIHILKKPERFYEAYSEFKKLKRQ